MVPHTSTYTVYRVYVWWSPLYIRTTDNSVSPPNLVYIRPKVQIAPVVSLMTQSPTVYVLFTEYNILSVNVCQVMSA
jgi:hypothetical protein